MHLAVPKFRNMIKQIASLALEDVEIGPYFPVYFAPRNSISFPDKGYKLLEIPRLIYNVLGSNLSVTIDVGLRLGAV